MDHERKKLLKKIGKKIIQENSEKFKAMLQESNPTNIEDPKWVENYKEIYHKEKIFQNNKSEVYTKEMIGVEFLLNSVPIDLENRYLPVQGYYLHCIFCDALVPMNPGIVLKCQCGSVCIDPDVKKVSFNPGNVEVVKLIAKASSK